MDEKNLQCLFYEQVHVKEEIEHVKEEAEWEDTAFLHGISEAAAQADLYAGHEVKDELVLGPEGLQPADVVFTLRAIDALYREQPALRECAVRLERLDLKTLFSSYCGTEQDSKPGYALIGESKPTVVLRDCVVKLERLVRQKPPRVGSSRAEHKKEIHNDTDNEIYICDTCKKWFSVKTELIEHVMIHIRKSAWSVRSERDIANGESAIVLRDCVVKLERLVRQEPPRVGSSRAEHKNETQNDTDNEIYICDTCKKWFSVKTELIEHVMIHVRSSAWSVRSERDIANGESAIVLRDCVVKLERLVRHKPPRVGSSRAEHKKEIHNDTDNEIYICDTCKKWFSVKTELIEHVMIHIRKSAKSVRIERDVPNAPEKRAPPRRDKEPLTCEVCNKQFATLNYLRCHKRIHTDIKPHQCNVCKKQFRQFNHLRSHQLVHTGERPFPCEKCGKKFTSASNLKTHGRMHVEGRPHICRICGQKFATLEHLREHKVVHAGEKPHSCEVCKRTFTFLHNLKQHSRTHIEKIYTCEICDRKFLQLRYLTGHQMVHSGIKPFSCEICEKNFRRLAHLQNHNHKVHTRDKPKPFTCGICKKKFCDLSNLNLHIRVHTGEKPYSCEICDKDFRQRTHLRIHTRVHTGERPYSCNICAKVCATSSALKSHQRIHTGVKPYSCNVCNKKFSHLVCLKSHKLRHAGKKPYSCEICKKMFTESGHLKIHTRRIHTGEKPYTCNVCNKRFTTFSCLKSHERVHTRKPFPL